MSFTNMKVRIRTSKIQPTYLQCEDSQYKAKLNSRRKQREKNNTFNTWHLHSKIIPKLRGKTKRRGQWLKKKFYAITKIYLPFYLRVQC